MRIRTAIPVLTDTPFTGDGVSFYVSAPDGTEPLYRNLGLWTRRRRSRKLRLKGQGLLRDVNNSPPTKTARIGFTTTSGADVNHTLGTEYANKSVVYGVRRFKDDVENLAGFGPGDNSTGNLDGNRDLVAQIAGAAELINVELQPGGVAVIRFNFYPGSGTDPTDFKAIRTAGPTAPADVTVSADLRETLHEITTPALSDASAYTYKIQAVNGATTKDVITGITFTVDATGPPAPSGVTTQAY